MSMGGFETTKINLSGKVIGMIRNARRSSDLAANKDHASSQEQGAMSAQKGIYSNVQTVESNPGIRPTPDTKSKQWAMTRGATRGRRRMPGSSEAPMGRHEAPQMGRHQKPPFAPEKLGRHAAGPPPIHEPAEPQPPRLGGHARP